MIKKAPTTRNSKQKSALLNLLKKGILDHPTADEIYREIKKVCPSISMGTVYRNLNVLSDRGEILKLEGTESADRFDHNTFPHGHMKCTQCGKIVDIMSGKHTEAMKKEFEAEGFQIDSINVVVRGCCPECAKKKNAQSN